MEWLIWRLEYCSLVLSPYLKKDILSIEKVQQRVAKMIPSISAQNYEERLKRTGLISLENRRLRADRSAGSVYDPERLRESKPIYPLQHERQKIQRTHAETRGAKGKIGAKKTLLLSPSIRCMECTTRPHVRGNINQHVQGHLTTATSWGVYKLEATACPSWPSDNR